MSLIKTIGDYLIGDNGGVVSITGAGGKTSTLKALGQYYRKKGLSVLLTTTTKIQSPKTFDYDADYAFTDEGDALQHEPEKGQSVFYAQRALMDPKKLVSPRPDVLSLLIKRYDVTIIEADGAKGLPLKYHSDRDPVIVDETTAVLAIMGASSYGDTVDNSCFGCESIAPVDMKFINYLIKDDQGALKGMRERSLLFINQADEKTLPLDEIICPVPLIMGSLKEDRIYGRKDI